MFNSNKNPFVKFISIFIGLLFFLVFSSIAVAVDLPFDPNEYRFLVYNPGGTNIIQAMQLILGRPLDEETEIRTAEPGHEVTLNDLLTYDILIVGENVYGDTSGLDANTLAQGITGRVILSGHDLDQHTVEGKVAAQKMLVQAINYILQGCGTGLITLGDEPYSGAAYSYLPKAWDVNAVTDAGQDVNSFTLQGLASGVFDGLEPNKMSNWETSYHNTLTIGPNSVFVPFELGGNNGNDIITIARSSVVLTKTDDSNAGGVKPNDRLTYTINYYYNNDANSPLHNAMIIDKLPPEVLHTNIVADHNGVYDSNTHQVLWNLGTLAAGTDSNVNVIVTAGDIRPLAECIVNTAKFTAAEINEVSVVRQTPWYNRVHNITKNLWYHTIQSAISDSNTTNGDVLVAYPASYSENINFGSKSLTLTSTNPDDETIVNSTIICGSGSGAAVTFANNSGSVLEGLMISNGSYGISCTNNSNPIINHCKVENASVYGIYCSSGSAEVTDTFINNNGSSIYGGGGLYSANANIIIDRCRIGYNSGTYGNSGSIYIYQGTAKITNSLIYNNNTFGIFLNDVSAADVRNNTVVYNSNVGIHRNYGGDPCIYSNIILLSNEGDASLQSDGETSFNKVNYNCIQYIDGNGNEGNYPGTGNINVDPCFVNAGANNYHLKKNSLCIDRGDPNFADANQLDIDGGYRVMDGDSDGNSRVDIGADEFSFDLTQDGFVNFRDFAVFAGSWKTSAGNANYNYFCDYFPDSKIDYKDLYIFCAHWLWPSDWEGASGGGDSMMMQEESEESQSIVFEESQEDLQESMLAGEGETPVIYLLSDVNEPNSGDEVTVQVYSDVPIFCMGLGITVAGDANITTALSTADCNEYGWDPGWDCGPYFWENWWVYIGGVKIEWDDGELIGTSGVVGYIKFRYNSGLVQVSITDGYGDTFDINCQPVLFSSDVLTFGPADSNEQ